MYHWEKLKFFLLIPGGYRVGGVAASKKCRLIITIDAHGIVSAQELKTDVDWGGGLL